MYYNVIHGMYIAYNYNNLRDAVRRRFYTLRPFRLNPTRYEYTPSVPPVIYFTFHYFTVRELYIHLILDYLHIEQLSLNLRGGDVMQYVQYPRVGYRYCYTIYFHFRLSYFKSCILCTNYLVNMQYHGKCRKVYSIY